MKTQYNLTASDQPVYRAGFKSIKFVWEYGMDQDRPRLHSVLRWGHHDYRKSILERTRGRLWAQFSRISSRPTYSLGLPSGTDAFWQFLMIWLLHGIQVDHSPLNFIVSSQITVQIKILIEILINDLTVVHEAQLHPS